MRSTTLAIRPASASADAEAILEILEPTIRAGETYALPADWSREAIHAYWFAPPHRVFVAVDDDRVVGTYFLQPNQLGPGAHVANCGFATHAAASGRGIAAAMCRHALTEAARTGFRAMQFNCVVSTNVRAVELWLRMGFAEVGRVPNAFAHPRLGYVDVLIMYRAV